MYAPWLLVAALALTGAGLLTASDAIRHAITITVLDAIAGACHADPFSVLGPHVERGRLTIRACLPAAEAVSVVRDGRRRWR